jgi:hypothetical protein
MTIENYFTKHYIQTRKVNAKIHIETKEIQKLIQNCSNRSILNLLWLDEFQTTGY